MSGLRNDWEDSEDTVATPDALDALLQAADGLLMPSESDCPFTAFRWPGPDPLTPAALLAHLGLPPDTPVEERAFSMFFARLTTAQDWHSDDDRVQVARFTALRDAFTRCLTDLIVYRVGVIRIDTFIVGTTLDGGVVGLRTVQIET